MLETLCLTIVCPEAGVAHAGVCVQVCVSVCCHTCLPVLIGPMAAAELKPVIFNSLTLEPESVPQFCLIVLRQNIQSHVPT